MAAPSSSPETWADVFFVEEPVPTISYRTALTVYEESLMHGRFVGRGWNGAGFPNNYGDTRLDPAKHAMPQAFWLEIDGQLLASHWEWAGLQKSQEEHGLHIVIALRHTVRPVQVRVHTLLDGTAVLTRWLEVTNTGTQPAALAAAAPWSGILQMTRSWRKHVSRENDPLYTVGYMANTHWGHEGDFQWHALPNAGYRIDGRYRRDRHRHPMFVLRNNATGEQFIGQLAWSGGYAFEFDLDADASATDGAARLFFRAGPDAPPPQRVLAPGERVTTPVMHLGMLFGDLDTAIQAMHDHLRRSVFMPQPRGRGGWVESGIGPELEITVAATMHQIDNAAAFGAEVFFIDASWYSPPHSHWWSTVGDWQVDRQRFPDGLAPIRDRVKELGILWGLWMDAERIGQESQMAQSHPEWFAVAYDGTTQPGGLIDLTNPAVAQWMEEQIGRVIVDNQLDFFRLDYNVSNLGVGAATMRDGFLENHYWRYYEALYAIYERLRARFPDVIFENCAGGGGRSDVGMVGRFSHTWVTDWQIAPRSFSITNGMTMALPPEYVDRLLAGQSGHVTADIDFQARLLLFARPTIGQLYPEGAAPNPALLSRVRHMVDLYKSFVRPLLHPGQMYHHTPTVPAPEPQGWGVLELASRDHTHAIAGLFRLSAPCEPEYLLRMRGLDESRRYRVTWDNTGHACELEGFRLINEGVVVRLEGPLTSQLLLVEAIQENEPQLPSA